MISPPAPLMTRRAFGRAIGGTALATGICGFVPAAEAQDWNDFAARLQQALAGAVGPGCPGTALNLRRLEVGRMQGAGPGTAVQAAVRLDWPPGFRTVSFLGASRDRDVIFDQVLDGALSCFADLHPACIRRRT